MSLCKGIHTFDVILCSCGYERHPDLQPNFRVSLTKDEVQARWEKWTPAQREAYKKFKALADAKTDDKLQAANFAAYKVEVENHGH